MKRLFLLFFCLIVYLNSFSQGEFNNWYFGFNAGITFNTSPPSAVTNGAIHFPDQTSTMSDATGNLLMYSEGQHVYNRNHIQMPNGFDLLGNPAANSHASIIIQKPGSTNLYYIFSVVSQGYTEGLKYAIVDMNLQGGNGDVISKNNSLVTPVCEKLTAVKHANGVDIWIITHQWNSNAFYAYLLASSGIGSPIVTNIGPIHTGGSGYNYNAAGQLTASTDGNKLAIATYEMGFYGIYDFNKTTGVISNQLQISGYNRAWGVQFSPDGTKLYATKWAFPQVYQFNLLAGNITNIINSVVTVGLATSPDPGYKAGFMQLAPDNKIYVAKMNAGYVSVINNPNSLGTTCNFIDNGLYLAGQTCQAGLPNFVPPAFPKPEFTFQNMCQGNVALFQSQNLSVFSNYSWDFGDPTSGINNTSNQQNPSHCYVSPGNFAITLIANQGSISDTVVHIITIYQIPQVNLGNDTSLCTGTIYNLSAGNPGANFLWSSGATTQTISVINSGTYWVSVSNGHCSNSDTIQIDFHTLPVNIGNDTVICGTSSYTLNGGPGGNYIWSTGETTQTISATISGAYWVSVTNSGCSGIDTIQLALLQPPQINLGNDTVVCLGSTIYLNTGISGLNYLWSTGEISQPISVNSSGTYWISVNDGNCSGMDTIQVDFQTMNLNLGNDTIICGASSHQLNAGNPGSIYLWSTGETTQSISININGSYWVSVSNSVCDGIDTILVSFSLPPSVDLGNDTILCPGNILTLYAGNPGANYYWSTGANSQSISITQSGIYWLEVSIGNCFVFDTMQIQIVPQLDLGGTISLCNNPEIVISVPHDNSLFTWSTGSTDTTLIITVPGSYWLSVETENCLLSDTLTVIGSIEYFYLPNAFTPNGDNLNDFYGPVCEGISEYHFMIFSSWGELIFETRNPEQLWDGRYKGKIVKVGVYAWSLDYNTACDPEKRKRKYGHVVVLK